MDMLCAIDVVEAAPSGTWRLKLTKEELSHFGQPPENTGAVSVLGIFDQNPSFDGKTLVFSLQGARTLNRGTGDEVIAVQLINTYTMRSPSEHSKSLSASERQLKIKGHGDEAFIQACKNESMPKSMISLAERFLEALRAFSDDNLKEGLNRKWTTQPNNFVAITIQNTKKNFAIHVRKTPQLDKLVIPTGPLDVRDDRPGYARFWITNEETFQAAIIAARASFEFKAARI